MSREIRLVPKDWVHPKNEHGNHKPLYESGFRQGLADYLSEKEKWDRGEFPEYASEENKKLTYKEWEGYEPKQEDYMPDFEEGTATYLMMYETTSEGTPISPAFETPEELARWLEDTGASSFGHMTATYEQWLNMCKRGSSICSAVMVNGEIISGVAA